jgi:hypothetical protein
MQAEPRDADDLARAFAHVADRLRHLAPARLAPVVDDVRAEVRGLARLALRAEGRSDQPLPDVAATALGDQVAVLGHDLTQALGARPDGALLDQARRVLVSLRRAVP